MGAFGVSGGLELSGGSGDVGCLGNSKDPEGLEKNGTGDADNEVAGANSESLWN